MSTFYDDGIVKLIHGDAIESMREIPDASIEAVVTDPPYGLSFMAKEWDHGVPGVPFWQEMLRVAKPGAYLLAFGGTRTVHRIATAIEDAGWEIRDMLVWGYASGFPKSLDVSKAIDKASGIRRAACDDFAPDSEAPDPADRDVCIGCLYHKVDHGGVGDHDGNINFGMKNRCPKCDLPYFSANPCKCPKPDAVSDDAKQWQGWGTALKPAWEPIVMARKPLIGTVTANVLEHGTGALNIDAARIPLSDAESFDDRDGEETREERYTDEGGTNFAAKPGRRITNPTLARYASGHSNAAKKALGAVVASESESGFSGEMQPTGDPSKGRWPANVMLTDPIFDGDYPDEVAGGGSSTSGASDGFTGPYSAAVYGEFANNMINPDTVYADTGGKSRFFLVPKADRAERERGLTGEKKPVLWSSGTKNPGSFQSPNTDRTRINNHPTVKPLDLMVHLVRLVTPPGGTVLDPFVGSGTTMLAASEEGYKGIGIDQSEDYLNIAKGRLIATPIGMGLAS